jgi:hypothetical protein
MPGLGLSFRWCLLPFEPSATLISALDSSCSLDRVAAVNSATGNLTLHSGMPSTVRLRVMLGTVVPVTGEEGPITYDTGM